MHIITKSLSRDRWYGEDCVRLSCTDLAGKRNVTVVFRNECWKKITANGRLKFGIESDRLYFIPGETCDYLASVATYTAKINCPDPYFVEWASFKDVTGEATRLGKVYKLEWDKDKQLYFIDTQNGII